MQTLKVNSFDKFKRLGCLYYPVIVNGRLLITNFAKNPNNAMKNKARLIITTTVVYNRGGFAAVHYIVVSKFGTQSGWCYFAGSRRLTWHKLSWDQRRLVVRSFLKFSRLDYMRPPTASFRRWAKTL